MGLGLVEWSPEFQEVRLEAARVVKVDRDFTHEADSFSGVLVAASDQARLYLVIHDLLIANGASMVRPSDIVAEVPDPRGGFLKSVVENKLAGTLPVAPKLSTISFSAICNWLHKAGVTAAFFEEGTEDAGCQVGRVATVTSDAVIVDTVTPSGEPDGQWSIGFADLTRVDCLGEYERSFDLGRATG